MSQVNSKDIRKAIKAFVAHVESLEKAEDPEENGFEAEYKLIQEAQAKNRRDNAFPMDVGKTENNLKKNRYKDILPYDEHRVVLSVIDGDPDSDYINASKLMGARDTGGYIATQGPLAITVNDFWRMIWEYNVEIIFMACRIVELGKIKCKQYWNDVDKSEEFGDITVTTEAEESIMSDCIRRNFQVTRGEEVRHVVQFHYSGWPDHGIPDDAGHIRDMIGIMRETRQNILAPLLVHCSAGCGRSGAIITIDYVWTLLEDGNFDDTFSLFDLICNFREQRMSIVQTADQYALVNKVLKTLCEEWLVRMASHTYENVDVDQADSADAQDASKFASGAHLCEDEHTPGNHVQDVASRVNQEHVERSQAPPVSPTKKKPSSTAYENLLQNEGSIASLAEKGSHKTVIHVEPSTKFGSPGSKKTMAPSPPSSPAGSEPKGGCKPPSQLTHAYQNTPALPSNLSPSTAPAVTPRPQQFPVNEMHDIEPAYSTINRGARNQKPKKGSPVSPTALYSLAKVLPAKPNKDYNKKVTKAPLASPQHMKPTPVSTDEFGYSSINPSNPPTPIKSPTPVSTLYSHLNQTSPSPAAVGSSYCTISNMTAGSLSTTYEDVRLPPAINKQAVPAGATARRQSNTGNTVLTPGQVNSGNIPGFNKRLPRVRGPVPMPQAWNKS